MPPFSLENETALITGGATGIGFGIASCMAQAGARVVLAGRREEVLAEAQAKLGGDSGYFVYDVTETFAADGLVEDVTERYGVPTILVNNAGNHLKKQALEIADDEFRDVIETHLTGAFALTRAVLPGMIERGSGNVLFISSMVAYMGIPQVTAYAAAKSALTGVIRTLATEFSSRGVRVNGIAPGWIETPMVAQTVHTDEARKEKILSRTPAGKLGDPDDIGWAAVYLVSQEAKFVTGTILTVDGGASIGF